MQTRNTLVMTLILLVLAGFVYVYEIRGRGEREEATRQEGLLLHFDIEQVERLEITTEQGTVVAAKNDGEWALVEPLATAADGEAIDALIDALHSVTQERQVVENAADLSPFGLDSPAATVMLGLAGGEQQSLAVGKDTPVGFNLYVTAGSEGTVHSVARALRASVTLGLFDLRDKTILSFEESQVRAIELSGGELAASLAFEVGEGDQEDGQWVARAPFVGRADNDTVERLLSALHTSEATAFALDAAPSAEQLAEYGLSSPRQSVTLRTVDNTELSLRIGGPSSEPEGFYAISDANAAVIVIDRGLLDSVPTTSGALRDKSVVTLSRERVTEVSVRGGSGSATVAREGSDWRITQPRPLTADASAVSRLLSAVEDLRAEGFAAATDAPQQPELVVTLSLRPDADSSASEPETLEIRVGDATNIMPLSGADDENPETVEAHFVSTSADPTVFLVATDDLADLYVDLFALRDKTLVQFNQTDLTDIELRVGASTYTLHSQDEEWRLTAPSQAAPESESVADLLWDLNYLRMEGVATEWQTGETPDLAAFGLQAPRLRLLARIGSEVVADVSIGAPAKSSTTDDDEARVYAIVGDQTAVFEIGIALADALDKLAEKLAAL